MVEHEELPVGFRMELPDGGLLAQERVSEKASVIKSVSSFLPGFKRK
jgi:hypothetical protein